MFRITGSLMRQEGGDRREGTVSVDSAAGDIEFWMDDNHRKPRLKWGPSRGTVAIHFSKGFVKVLGPATASSATFCMPSMRPSSVVSLEQSEA